MQRKKVLWLASSYPRYETDSASIFLRHLAHAIQLEDFDLHILSPDHTTVEVSKQHNDVVDHRFCYFFPRRLQQLAYGSGILANLQANPWLFLQIPFFLLFQFISAWRLILQLKPDLIHAHWIFPQGYIGTLLGKWLKIPVIVTAHGGDAFSLKNAYLGKIKLWTLQNCSAWTSNTMATAQAAGKNLSSPNIIPMGINSQLFGSGTALPKPPGKFVLLFVGRLVEKKGSHDLITAFSLLDKSLQTKTELWIIGDGAQRNALETLVQSLNLSKQITFLGRIPNQRLPDYYATADIFVAPSIVDISGDTEGQGVILLEALASGAAIVSTRTGGIGEIIENGKTGLLVNPNDPPSLKTAIELLLNNPELRKSLTSEGKKIILQYDWTAIAIRFCNLYRQVLNNCK